MTTILENFIDKELQDAIERNVLSSNVGWFYNRSTVNPTEGVGYAFKPLGINPHQFSIPITQESLIFQHITPIFENLSKHYKSDIQVLRIKFNLLNRLDTTEFNYPHIDTTEKDFISLVYYVNDSDGDTVIFNESHPFESNNLTVKERVSPKKGRAVLINADTYHSASNPRNTEVRVILNVVFRLVKTVE